MRNIIAAALVLAAGSAAAQQREAPAGAGFATEIDNERFVRQKIEARRGGRLSVTAADGTRYTLILPPNGLLLSSEITLAPVKSTSGIPGLRRFYGVEIGPGSTELGEAATLLIEPPGGAPAGAAITVEASGRGAERTVGEGIPAETGFAITLTHFSEHGIATTDPGAREAARAALQDRVKEATRRGAQRDIRDAFMSAHLKAASVNSLAFIDIWKEKLGAAWDRQRAESRVDTRESGPRRAAAEDPAVRAAFDAAKGSVQALLEHFLATADKFSIGSETEVWALHYTVTDIARLDRFAKLAGFRSDLSQRDLAKLLAIVQKALLDYCAAAGASALAGPYRFGAHLLLEDERKLQILTGAGDKPSVLVGAKGCMKLYFASDLTAVDDSYRDCAECLYAERCAPALHGRWQITKGPSELREAWFWINDDNKTGNYRIVAKDMSSKPCPDKIDYGRATFDSAPAEGRQVGSVLLHWDTSVRYYISLEKCVRADSDRPNQGYTLFIGIKDVNCEPW